MESSAPSPETTCFHSLRDESRSSRADLGGGTGTSAGRTAQHESTGLWVAAWCWQGTSSVFAEKADTHLACHYCMSTPSYSGPLGQQAEPPFPPAPAEPPPASSKSSGPSAQVRQLNHFFSDMHFSPICHAQSRYQKYHCAPLRSFGSGHLYTKVLTIALCLKSKH